MKQAKSKYSFLKEKYMPYHVKDFFKDKSGKVVIAQKPNTLIYIWLVLVLMAFVSSENWAQTGFKLTASAVLFCWAYLELTDGASRFRQTLGAVVMAAIIYSFYQ